MTHEERSVEIEIECEACRGTGLYVGFAEPPETAVVCNRCRGSGKQILSGKPFTHRRRRRDVKWVIADGGLWFARTGKESKITVEEFYKR